MLSEAALAALREKDAFGLNIIARTLLTAFLNHPERAEVARAAMLTKLTQLGVGQLAAGQVTLAEVAMLSYEPSAVASDILDRTIRSLRVAPVETPGQQAAMVNRIQGLSQRLGGMVEDIHHTAAQQYVIDQAREADEDVVWVAERNACPSCLDMAGAVLNLGGGFVGVGLTGEPQTSQRPPKHPNCRCELERVPRDATEDYAGGMRREAARSAALGLSDFASKAKLVELASRVSTVAPYLPKRVLDRAAKAAATGAFGDRPR